MKITIEEKKLVMGLYCITMLLSMLSIVDNVPFRALTYNIQYVFLVIIIFFCFYDGILVWNTRMIVGIGILVLHTILYCMVFTNPYIKAYTDMHFKQLMSAYIISFFTCIYVYKKRCYQFFLEMSYLSLALYISWCAITHLGNFVNPVYFTKIFSRMERFRAAFGMGDVNYCGNYCVYLLIVYVFLVEEWKKNNKKPGKKLKYVMIGVNIITTWMLLSTASRSGIISLCLFIILFKVLELKDVILKHWKIILKVGGTVTVVGLIIVFSTGMLSDIWSESNREGNFSINQPIFLQYGNLLNGMGYMDNSGWLNKLYGFETTAMDVYYLYVIYDTGYLGAFLIFSQMLYLLYYLIRYSKVQGRNLALSLFVMMLYYCIWQVNYMNYRYFTGIIHMVILFFFLMRINEEEDTYMVKIQRR